MLKECRASAREVAARISAWERELSSNGGLDSDGRAGIALVAPGGPVEQAEVDLTAVLVRIEESVDPQRASDNGLPTFVKSLGERLAKLKAQVA